MSKRRTSAKPRRTSSTAPLPPAEPAEPRPGEHAPAILPTNPFTVPGLEGYIAEVAQIEDKWFHQEFVAKTRDQRYKEFQLGRSPDGSHWRRNITSLKELGHRHGVAEGDPRVYSITAYRAELKAINDEWERVCTQNGWTDETQAPGAWRRHEVHKADCEANYFPVPGGTDRMAVGLFCGAAPMSSLEWLTRPVLWQLIQWALKFVGCTHGSQDNDNRIVGRVYRLLHQLGVDWAPEPPYPTLTTNEASDRLCQIANQLVQEEGTEHGGDAAPVVSGLGDGDGLVWHGKKDWAQMADCDWRTLKKNLEAQRVPVLVDGRRVGLPFSRLSPPMKAEITRRKLAKQSRTN
jgi:hypothetical protein